MRNTKEGRKTRRETKTRKKRWIKVIHSRKIYTRRKV